MVGDMSPLGATANAGAKTSAARRTADSSDRATARFDAEPALPSNLVPCERQSCRWRRSRCCELATVGNDGPSSMTGTWRRFRSGSGPNRGRIQPNPLERSPGKASAPHTHAPPRREPVALKTASLVCPSRATLRIAPTRSARRVVGSLQGDYGAAVAQSTRLRFFTQQAMQ